MNTDNQTMKALPTTKCRSCGTDIIWAVLPSGKKCPLDAEPITLALKPSPHTSCYDLEWRGANVYAFTGERTLDEDSTFYVSHFATCPNAREHSKK